MMGFILVILYLLLVPLLAEHLFKKIKLITPNIRRITAKSLVISLSFSPSIIAYSYAAFPAPLPLAIIYYLHKTFTEKSTIPLKQLLFLGLAPAVIVFVLCFIIGIARNAIRNRRAAHGNA